MRTEARYLLDRRSMKATVMVTLLLGVATPLAAQESCPQGRVTSIFVDNHSIFDPDDLAQQRSFLWAYRLANTLHMRTGESFLRSELLFQEGDCYDPSLLAESERLIRLYPFISTVDVYGIQQPDGGWHVLVDTKDDWTTKFGVHVDFNGALRFRGADVTEENLVGRGILASLFYRELNEQRDLGATVFTPRLLGTRTDAFVSGGRTRIGSFFQDVVIYPFVGEMGRLAARQVYLQREEFFPYSLGVRHPGSGQITHVLLPTEEERIEVTLAGRIGSPGNLTTFGVGMSKETLEFPRFPDGLETAQGDFGDRDLASPEYVRVVEPHTNRTSATRLNVMVGQRNIRYEQRRRLDAISGVQDVPVGTDAGLTLGRNVSGFSGGPDDLYARLRFSAGAVSPEWVLSAGFSVEGRQIFAGGTTGQGWHDVLGETDILTYWQPSSLPRHTFFARLDAAGGWTLDQPFQLTLGGEAGVRGFHEDDFPGGRRILASVEDRIAVAWPGAELVDLGLTFFADAGQMWGANVPFGADSGWKGALGGGLRFGFPAGTRGVVRLDAAFPVGGGASLGDFIMRVSLADLLGLASGLRDRQMDRSRRITVGPDVFTPERRR